MVKQRIRQFIGIFLSLCMVTGMLAPAESGIGDFFGSLTMSASADSAMVDYGEPTFDSDGISKSSRQCTTVTSSTKFTGGWYYVGSDVKFGEVKVTGDTKIILGAGKTMKCTDGIVVLKGNSLTIYNEFKRDSNGDIICGTLDTYSKTGPGIGGNNGNVGGDITINGGIIKAKSDQCAGIGGGRNGSGIGDITINYGTVTATGGTYCPGIGTSYGNKSCGTITISGGTVTATGGTGGAGIGTAAVVPDSNNMAEGSFTVNITGGTVTAKGGSKGAGIGTGCGREKNSDPKTVPYACTVNISGGYTNVTAIGGDWGAGIGGGKLAKGGTVTISDGIVIAKGGYQAAGIGGGSNALKRTSGGTGNGGNVTITGGTVEAYGAFNKSGDGTGAAGIGGGYAGNQGGTVRITYGNVTVKGNKAPAIGGGAKGGSAGGSDGTLTFDGSEESEYVKVTVGSEVADKAMRESKCRLKSTEVVINTCFHENANYSIKDDEKHTKACPNCGYSKTEDHYGTTCVCGYTQPRYIVSVICPEGSYNYDVAVGNTVYLPDTGIVKTNVGTDLGCLYERVSEWRIKGTDKVIAAGGGYVVSTGDKDAEATDNTITVNPEYMETYGELSFEVTGGEGSVSAVGGTVEVTNSGENTVTVAKDGNTVTLRVSPDQGWNAASLIATNGTDIIELTPVSDTEYTFTMPGMPVRVSAVFEQSYVYHAPVSATCTTAGSIGYYTKYGKYYILSDTEDDQPVEPYYVEITQEETVIPAGHVWFVTGWAWSEDHTTATASFECQRDTDHTESADATVTTATEGGVKTYTATAMLDGVDYTDEYSEEVSAGPITYVDPTVASGTTTVQPDEYTLATSSDGKVEWSGTMVVQGEVTIDGNIELTGDTDLILCDGATLTISNTDNAGIIGGSGSETDYYSLNIFGQTKQSGKLTREADDTGIFVKNINVYGGDISSSAAAGGHGIYAVNACNIVRGKVNAVTGTGTDYYGIKAGSSITISGGNVTVGGSSQALYSGGTVTLGWTTSDDRIEFVEHGVDAEEIIFDKAFTIDDNGTLATADNIDDKTLTPAYAVTFMDGDEAYSTVGVPATGTATVTKPDDPTKDGYTFIGWFEEDTETEFDFDTAITEDITLYAHWIHGGYCGVVDEEKGLDGTQVIWEISEDGKTITISGTGAMADYDTDAPWFDYYETLNKVDIKECVTRVGNKAFYSEIYSLSEVSLPDSLEELGNDSFSGSCKNITTIKLPSNLRAIGDDALRNNGFTSLTVPERVEVLGTGALADNESMTTVTFETGSMVKVIPASCFANCTLLESVTLPGKLDKIEEFAFCDCDSLSSMSLTERISSLGRYALPNTSLKSLDFAGTKEQWSAIEKNDRCVPTTELLVTCSNGVVVYADISSDEDFTVSDIPDQTYTGSPIRPKPTVKYRGKTLTEGEHYTLTYVSNTNPGNRIIYIYGKNEISGTKTVTFEIKEAEITADDVTVKDLVYTNEWQYPDITVTVGGKTLEENCNYTYELSNDLISVMDVGTYTATITGIDFYTGTVVKTFEVKKGKPAEEDIKITINNDYKYSGEQIKPLKEDVAVVINHYCLDDDEFDLTYGKNINAGTGTITVKSNDECSYVFEKTAEFEIERCALPDFSVSIEDWTYGETPNEPVVTGNLGGGAVSYTYSDLYDPEETQYPGVPTEAGSYKLYAHVEETTNYYQSVSSCLLHILKPQSVITKAPTAKTGLAYTGKSQVLINAGTATGGTLEYSLNGTDYSTTVPTGKNAETYTVYYRVTGDDTHEGIDAETIKVKIAKAAINPTVTIADWTYGEAASEPAVIGNTGSGAVTFTYSADGTTFTADVPATVGTYTVKASVAATTNYEAGEATATFEIKKAQSVITKAPTAKTGLEYTGKSQTLITAGTATGGTLEYSLDNKTYSTTVPTGKTAKTYTVYYRVTGDDTHEGIDAETIKVKIAKAAINPTVTIADWTYGEAASEPVVTGNTGSGTVTFTYSADGTAFSEQVPTAVGTYTVKASVAATTNYAAGEATATFEIKKAQSVITKAPTAKTGLEYTGKSQALINAGTATGGTLEYSLNGTDYSTTVPTGKTAKTYTVYYRVTGDGNHEGIDAETIKVTIAKAAINPTVTIADWTYGEAASEPVVTGNTGSGAVTFTYSADGTTFTADVPATVGTYTVKASVAATTNYEAGEATATFEIGKAELTVSGAAAESRNYNGLKAVKITEINLDGIVGNDDVFVYTTDITGTLAGAEPGTYTEVTLPNGLKLGGADKGKYTLTQPTQPVKTNVVISEAPAEDEKPIVTPETGDGYVILNWNPVKDAEKYAAYYYDTVEKTTTVISSKIKATSRTVSKLTNGETYSFLVRAYVGGKWTKYDENDIVTVTLPSNRPVVMAVPGDRSATLSWNEITDAERYAAYVEQEDGTMKCLASRITDTTYTVKKLTNGETYKFLVRAYIGGKWTKYDETDIVECRIPSGRPEVTAKSGDSTVTLTWDAIKDAARYAAYIEQEDGTMKCLASKLTDTTYTVKKLTNGTAYRFLVRAYVNGVWTKYTEDDIVECTPVSNAPVSTATPGNQKVTLTWNLVEAAEKYAAYIVNDDDSLTCVSSKITNTRYTIKNLTNDKEYRFLVRAYVDGKWSNYTATDIVTATPKA